MLTSFFTQARRFLFPSDPVPAPPPADNVSVYERFAIPYTFKPQMGLLEAILSALAAFLRICCGCLWFAVWGAYTYWICAAIPVLLFRPFAFVVLLAVFLLGFGFMMQAVSALLHRLWPNRRSA